MAAVVIDASSVVCNSNIAQPPFVHARLPQEDEALAIPAPQCHEATFEDCEGTEANAARVCRHCLKCNLYAVVVNACVSGRATHNEFV